MTTKISYLFSSKTGFYEYRRRVPNKLKKYFPRNSNGKLMTEWKQSLHTKSEAEARRRWLSENEHFEATKYSAEQAIYGVKLPENETHQSAISAAKETALRLGVHPDQAPTLTVDATENEILDFRRKALAWKVKIQEHQDILADIIHDNHIDEEQRAKDYKTGSWGTAGYQTPYKPENPNDPLIAQYKIVGGSTGVTSQSTWADAAELYIKTNKREKIRLADVEAKWERKTRGVLSRFATAMGGADTPLENLDRQIITDWLWDTYPNAGTRNRNNNTLSAVINCWNREKKGQSIFNPFSGLSNKKREKNERNERRSFKPEELSEYLYHIMNMHDAEVRLIGLLMIYTGCRTSEAAGLQVKDLRNNTNMPHVVYRTNSIRRMDKNDLERAVPLLTPLVDEFRSYEKSTNMDAPLFPSHYSKRGHENASAALRNIVNNVMGISDKAVVPYSARHTIRDRSSAARVELGRAEYIMGHISVGSSRVHQEYGTATPPEILFEDMTKIFAVTDWGFYEN